MGGTWQEQYEADKAANQAERAWEAARHAPARAYAESMTASATAAWRLSERRAEELRESGDEYAARDLLQRTADMYGMDPRSGKSSTQVSVEAFREREERRSRGRRELDAGEVREVNDARNRAGLPPVDGSTLALAARLAGTERPERKRRRGL